MSFYVALVLPLVAEGFHLAGKAGQVLVGAAAVVLGLLWLRTGHSQGDPVRRVIAAYNRDMDSLNWEITAFCLRTGADTSQINRTIRIIDCEAVPLYEQLPDELDDAEKVRILRRYFGLKIDAVRQLRAQIADEQ